MFLDQFVMVLSVSHYTGGARRKRSKAEELCDQMSDTPYGTKVWNIQFGEKIAPLQPI